MTGAAKFSIDIDKAFDDLIEEQFLPFKQKIALQALTGITLKMPVDTGRARGNTFVSLGEVGVEITETKDKTGGAAIAKGQAVILRDRDHFQPVYVYNNLPYIERLENGYSGQAPQGMFALTVQEIETQFK